jgi:hypothetical protein
MCKIDHLSFSNCGICDVENGRRSTAMSTINEVRAAEEKMKTILDGLKTSKAQEDPNSLGTELKSASDEYARAVRELEWT